MKINYFKMANTQRTIFLILFFTFLFLGLSQIISADLNKITVIDVFSHPQAGDNWTVSFETKGTADLTITPDDQISIDDLDFVSLKCGEEERTPQILENDVIFYPDWICDETGEATHLVSVARKHTLMFQFGDKTAYAYNNPDTSTYNFVGVIPPSSGDIAYEKYGASAFTGPTDTGNGEATQTDYGNIESTNDVRWTTDGASTDGHYDSQLYKFYINEDESSVTQLDFAWEGYGETHGTGYLTTFYAWNYASGTWDLLQEVTFTAATDQNLIGSKTTDAGNYIKDSNREVTLMAKTKTDTILPSDYCASRTGDYQSKGQNIYCADTHMWSTTDSAGHTWNPSDGIICTDACDYCTNLDYAGFTDWVLADKDTLDALWDGDGGYFDCVNTSPFGPSANCASWDTNCCGSSATYLGPYWSSTLGGSGAWVVRFSTGAMHNLFRYESYWVRCVRQ